MESLRRGFRSFQTSINTESVQNENRAMHTARDLLHQVAQGKLSKDEAIEHIAGIKDKEKSDLTLDHFRDFEGHELGRTSRT